MNTNVKRFTGLKIILAVYLSLSAVLFVDFLSYADEDWKAEFNDVCSKTNEAMSLTREELISLVERCDTLKSIVEGLDESPRKVYLKRLQVCRDFYVFVLESKQ